MADNIGKGWSFPPHFDNDGGNVIMTSGEAEIQGSLSVLFSTRLEERIFRPDYGCSLDDYQFRSLDTATIIRMRRMIDQAVRKYEPRIEVHDIVVGGSGSMDGELRVSLTYSIIGNVPEEKHTFHYCSLYLEHDR